jgi:hypothetical protein
MSVGVLTKTSKTVSAYGAALRLFHPMYAGANMGHPPREEPFTKTAHFAQE